MPERKNGQGTRASHGKGLRLGLAVRGMTKSYTGKAEPEVTIPGYDPEPYKRVRDTEDCGPAENLTQLQA
jgi:hypothetical protein